jgi:holliday junction DNA helicase RuvA
MIATLEGIVSEKMLDVVVLTVHGVGYGLLVTTEDYGRLHAGESAKVYVYEHIREVSYDLFGFLKLDTKQGTAGEVRGAIATGDVKTIQRANGVGKRVAERIVVELKDKVGLEGVELATTGLLQSDNAVLADEAAQALVSLGYSPQDAAKALQKVDESLSTEERIKLALKG